MDRATYARRLLVIGRLRDSQASLEASGDHHNAGFMRLAIDVLEPRNRWQLHVDNDGSSNAEVR